SAHAQESRARIKKAGDSFELLLGDEIVSVYHHQGFAKPIFWPVFAPGKVPLTRNYPPPEGQAKDHPHQKSAWFCHGDVIPEGIEFKSKIKNVEGVDFWSEAKGHGQITTPEAKILDGQNGVVAVHRWLTADGKKI